MRAMYTLEACERLIAEYLDRGGEVVTVQEGGVGLGLVVCFGHGLKTAIIRERYRNEWNSDHTIILYNKMPAKYRAMVDAVQEDGE